MHKPYYNKPHLSHEEHVDRLISRGMVISDRVYAIQKLQHISYYRLGVYWHSYEIDHKTHQIKSGTRFEEIVVLYEFDRKLRLLVLDAIERFEVSVRAQWTHHMGKAYGSHAHMIEKAHSSDWQKTVKELQKELRRTDEKFIKRFIEKYSDASPPIWAVSEIISFGLLSKWFKNLRVNTVRKNISQMYGVHPDILQSWLQHFTVVRNNCAHHSRLWNRQFNRIAPMLPKHHPAFNPSPFVDGYPLANSIVILLYLLDIISPDHGWRQRFITLTEEYPSVSLQDMGLPNDWRAQKIWQWSV